MNDWKERCTIGITTRDRTEDLRHTVEMQKTIGLGDMRYIIVDDGSTDANALREITAQLPRCRFIRHDRSSGYIQRRQEMAELCETEFLISLDDDSYFVNLSGMEAAIGWMDADAKHGLVSFKIIQLKNFDKQMEARTTQFLTGPLYWFRGCGYITRISTFLQAGGFPAKLRHTSEELHLVHQFFRLNLAMRHQADVIVEHRWTPAARNLWSRAKDIYCSQTMVKLLNHPLPVALAGVLWLGAWKSWRGPDCFTANIAGWWQGVLAGFGERYKWKQLTLRQFLKMRTALRLATVPEEVELRSVSLAANGNNDTSLHLL
jgi:hypothetical protein